MQRAEGRDPGEDIKEERSECHIRARAGIRSEQMMLAMRSSIIGVWQS
jgi:hypothetical protein